MTPTTRHPAPQLRARSTRLVVAGIIALSAVLGGCSASGDDMSAADEGGTSGALGGDARSGTAEQPADGSVEQAASTSDADRQVIQTGDVRMTVKDPLDAADAVVVLAEGAGGRVDDRSEHAATKDDVGTAELTIRLPADEVSRAVDGLRELGTIDELNLTSEDVTGTAQDLDARIRALQLSVARMEDLLTRATTNEQLIAAESALTERQSSLEQLQSERARLAEKVRLSTIHVVLYGPELAPVAPVEPETGPQSFLDGLAAGWAALVDVASGLAIVVGVLLPWLAFGGAVAALVVAAVRWNRRRRATGPIGQPAPAVVTSVPGPAPSVSPDEHEPR
ncbi:DUF4349 domain-containing protein [Cellulomonas sp. Root137]|uniref:DUF4349 domain-containing protein n=1 Tax=Cellulomonas sp. Root137 TaxID=1736459 RepID=UPI000A69C259|nr:DUF4349 domain-containing protein [Cellulomonas sp. Root137]